jgi:hypothetical protein
MSAEHKRRLIARRERLERQPLGGRYETEAEVCKGFFVFFLSFFLTEMEAEVCKRPNTQE